VFLASNFAHHDRRIAIPGFTEYGVGSHEAHSAPLLAAHLACKVGTVTTSNSLDHNADDDKHMAANDAAVKDMEGAAIAWVTEQTATALLGIKVVTDIVDGDRATHEVLTHTCTHAHAHAHAQLLLRFPDGFPEHPQHCRNSWRTSAPPHRACKQCCPRWCTFCTVRSSPSCRESVGELYGAVGRCSAVSSATWSTVVRYGAMGRSAGGESLPAGGAAWGSSALETGTVL